MRLVTQSVQEQDVEIAQPVQRLSGHIAMVGQVSSRSETETQDGRLAMNHGHRLKTRAEQLNRAVNRLHFHLRQTAEFVVRVENVAKHIAQEFCRARFGIQRQSSRLVREAKWPQIIHAKNVICM